MSSPFRRFLSPAFTSAMAELAGSAEGGWWRDVLLHPDLIVAIRTDALNVYYRGASVFRVILQDGQPVAYTHLKYLVRQRQAYAPLGKDGRFQYDPQEALWTRYERGLTLGEMLSAADRLAGDEKRGLHELIKGSPRVIDVEINFRNERYAEDETPPSDKSPEDVGTETKASSKARFDRLDAATLEDRAGQLWIVFHEAKHFANVELRAGPEQDPKVFGQIKRYRRSIAAREGEIKMTYRDVCRALRELHAIRLGIATSGTDTPLDPLIERAAGGEVLQVDPEPRLIVFGFDKDQRKGPIWQHHRSRLSKEFGLTVYTVGNPTKKSAAAFARRPDDAAG